MGIPSSGHSRHLRSGMPTSSPPHIATPMRQGPVLSVGNPIFDSTALPPCPRQMLDISELPLPSFLVADTADELNSDSPLDEDCPFPRLSLYLTSDPSQLFTWQMPPLQSCHHHPRLRNSRTQSCTLGVPAHHPARLSLPLLPMPTQTIRQNTWCY